jgi:2-succinyl-5-enolpyruvyl-6-hydroxy-3-cyclohexene-1-carboxylate synthase
MVDFLSERGYVVVGDATTTGTVPYFDTLLRSDAFARDARPDCVVRVGGLPASKVLGQRLVEWAVPVIAFAINRDVADPDRVASETLSGEWRPNPHDGEWDANHEYQMWWNAIVARYEQQVVGLDFAAGALTESSAARAVVRHVDSCNRPLYVGSSMPIREIEWFTPSRRQDIYSNRGVNGIDGVVSSAFGARDERGIVALVGDLTFAHDLSAWVDAPHGEPVSVVIADNGGGHIFDFLPQRGSLDASTFADLFTTARPLDHRSFAAAVGVAYHEVTTVGELDAALRDDYERAQVSIIRARVNTTVSTTDFHAWLHKASGRIVAEFCS